MMQERNVEPWWRRWLGRRSYFRAATAKREGESEEREEREINVGNRQQMADGQLEAPNTLGDDRWRQARWHSRNVAN